MSEVTRYRLKQYSASGKAWEIDIEKVNAKTGEARWETIKYPGDMLQAAETAVALQLGDDFTADSLQELTEAVSVAVEKVVSSMQAFGGDVLVTIEQE